MAKKEKDPVHTEGTSPSTTPVTFAEMTDLKAFLDGEISRFIKLAKESGSLTIKQIDELLAPEIVKSEALDYFMSSLEIAGISIEDHNELDGQEEQEGFLEDANSDSDEEETLSAEELKGSDPVRMYLRKMGSVSLLTREGEVEIARKIEKGEREIVRAILMSPIGTFEIVNLGRRLDEGRIKVKSIFRGLEDEDSQYDEKEYIEKIHELIGHVNEYQTRKPLPIF
jgi:RNA polymerase primary sigma factor